MATRVQLPIAASAAMGGDLRHADGTFKRSALGIPGERRFADVDYSDPLLIDHTGRVPLLAHGFEKKKMQPPPTIDLTSKLHPPCLAE